MKNSLLWLILIGAAFLAGANLFSSTTEVMVPGPPVKPDTIWVHEFDIDTIFRDRIREVVVSDTVNIIHQVVITDTIRLESPEPRMYLDALYAPQTRGDTAIVSLVTVGADSAGAWRLPSVNRLWWPGQLRSIETHPELRFDFYDPPRAPRECAFGCRALLMLGGAAAGVILTEVF